MSSISALNGSSTLCCFIIERSLAKWGGKYPSGGIDRRLDSDSFEVVCALLVSVWSVNEPIGSESLDEAPVDVGLDCVILFCFDWLFSNDFAVKFLDAHFSLRFLERSKLIRTSWQVLWWCDLVRLRPLLGMRQRMRWLVSCCFVVWDLFDFDLIIYFCINLVFG